MPDAFIHLVADLGQWGYLAVFLAATLESAAFVGLLIPGESVVLLAGFLASRGVFDVGDLIVIVCGGAILGDTLGYELGRHIGRAELLRYTQRIGVDQASLQRVDRFFVRYGGKTVFVGRFIGFVRALAPFVAGSSRMRYREFMLYNAAGGAAWAATFVSLGFVFGESWHRVEVWMGRASALVGAAFIVLLGLILLGHWVARHEAALDRLWATVGRRLSGGALGGRTRRARAFLSARLSPEGELGFYLTLGVLVLTACAWLFGGIAEDVLTGDPLTRVDHQVSLWFEVHATPGVTRAMIVATQLGGWRVVTALTVIVGLALMWRRSGYWLITLLLTVPGGAFLNGFLKQVFHRARPHWEHPLVMLRSFSFPSGHAMSATTLYGFLATWLTISIESWRWRVAIAVIAVALILLIDVSRVYLGAHYPSDVLGGSVAGLAWLAVCATAVEIERRRRRARPDRHRVG